jgi:hypothetical protein
MELMPRVIEGQRAWNVALRYSNNGTVEPEIVGNDIVYQHDDVIQQFTNSPAGIEQSITLLKKLQAHGNLTLYAQLEMQGLEDCRHAGNCLILSGEDGEITYRVFDAKDAQDKTLRSSIDYDGSGGLSLSVSEDKAIYPIHMKILISSSNEQLWKGIYSNSGMLETRQNPDPDWTAESDQADAWFGVSVSTAGDVNNDGYADVIIGAHGFTHGQWQEGRTFVYHGGVSGLSQTPDWTAESDQGWAHFGISVSAAGDVNNDGYADVIVGAPGFDNGQEREGRAYVYHGSASGLSQTADWTVESDQVDAGLGNSVSAAGDVNNDGYADVIVGASHFDNGQVDEGCAFVFHGSTSGLSATADWTAESDQENARFGVSVSTAGDVNNDGCADVIVGAHQFENGQNREGRAYIYCGSASGLSQTADWIAESDQGNAHFGASVSAAGDVNNDGYDDVIVGAPEFNHGQWDEGRAYVYYGSASGLSQTADWTAEPNQDGAHFGRSVSVAGDVNNDGYDDVIVGAPEFDNGQNDEGCVFMYYGRASGVSTYHNWTVESDQIEALFGNSVSTAGDVNNDGYDDVIVGAHRFDNGQVDEGRAFVYHGRPALLHNIRAISLIEPSDDKYEEFTAIQPSAVFANTGFTDETNVPVTCVIRRGMNVVYTSNKTINSFVQNTDTLIVFDEFTVEVCGCHYDVYAFSSLPEDTVFSDDTTQTEYFVSGRYYELTALGCNAWKYPDADSGVLPYPTDPNWILATQPEIQQMSALDSTWWVTAGAIDSAHQDLQMYGIQLDAGDTLIEELTVEWWGHHGDTLQPHNQCVLYFWNNDSGVWSRRADAYEAYDDVHFTCEVPSDSFGTFVNSWGYFYVATASEYTSCCPLLFTFDGEKNVFIGDIITGCDLGMWVDRVLGNNFYVPPDYDEYVRIEGEHLKQVEGRYRLSINEMLQEVSYLDEVKLYVIDHPVDYDVYPHEALIFPGYQGLNIHTSEEIPLTAAIDNHGRDILHALEKEDLIYAPFERSGITGFAKPYTITLDFGELEDSESAVLYLHGSTRFQDSREIQPVSDIYQAGKRGMKLQNPRVEVIDASGRWRKLRSCGAPRGHKKTVTYPLYDDQGKTIFTSNDHRLRITFYGEVYLDKAWVSCCTKDDYRVVELAPEVADLRYYGYAQYHSSDGRYPGTYSYDKKVRRDYANVVGYYTKYGDVRPLMDAADSRFVIMCHGDEISLEFDAEQLPELPEGWKRDFVFASKGFYKMARPGRAYAYSVDPLPFYGMRDDMSANGVGYYPYDPSPNLLASLLGRVYGKLVFDYPFSLSEAFDMITKHLAGKVKGKYPAELVEYCQEWNTRHVGGYYPEHYADAPPHLNLERVPLHEDEGEWTTHLASLGIPFGDHSLHSNYVRVWFVATVPLAVAEHKLDVPARFAFEVGNPNPFRKSTRISYTIPSRMQVCLNVYDLSGRLVRTLVNESQSCNSYTVLWDGSDNLHRKCSSGVYFVTLTIDTEFSETEKILFIK